MKKVFGIFIILFAIVLAALGLYLPREKLTPIIMITNFVEIMLPILGVGALIAFIGKICFGCCHSHEKKETDSSCCQK